MPLLKPSSGSESVATAPTTPGMPLIRDDELAHVRRQLCRLVEARVGDRQAQRQHVGRVEAELDVHHPEEAADEQTGADEEHERERDFDHHERAAQAAASGVGGRAASAFLHRAGKIRFRGLQRRRKPEDDSGQNRQRHREGDDARVHGHVDIARQRERWNEQLQPGEHQP